MYRISDKPPPHALNEDRMRALALHYVGKYATTRAKLAAYLNRKIRERGWDDKRPADIDGLVNNFSELGYINEAQFAEARSRTLVRRGYGKRRLEEDLRAAGIQDGDSNSARLNAESSEFMAAENFARRKRIGPFAQDVTSPEKRQKNLHAFLRAGHSFALARMFVNATPDDLISED